MRRKEQRRKKRTGAHERIYHFGGYIAREIVGAWRVGSVQGSLGCVQGERDGMKIKIQHETEKMKEQTREAN